MNRAMYNCIIFHKLASSIR